MKRSQKLAFIGFLSGFGGAERSMIMLANALTKYGYNISLITIKDNDSVFPINSEIHNIFIPDKFSNKLVSTVHRFISLAKILRDTKPDVVISFWAQPIIMAVILAKFFNFKTIYSERGDPTDKEYSGLLGVLRSIFFKFVDGFVFQTEGARKCFCNTIQKKSIVINNPIYIKYNDYPIPITRRKIIINVGRLHEQKNQSLLIDAFYRVSSEFPDYSLEIFGDGPLKKQLKTYVDSLYLSDKVTFRGTTDNLFIQICDASLFILSSDYEGMPNALMEAMALGIPCITTDCRPGGARELITNGDNGLICQRQSAEQLANCIRYMLKEPIRANKMGIKGKEICNTHSVDVIFDHWHNYIASFSSGFIHPNG